MKQEPSSPEVRSCSLEGDRKVFWRVYHILSLVWASGCLYARQMPALPKSCTPGVQGWPKGDQHAMVRWEFWPFPQALPSCLPYQSEDVLGIGTKFIRTWRSSLPAAFEALKRTGLDFSLFACLKHYNLEKAVWPGQLLIYILFFRLQTQNHSMVRNRTRRGLKSQLAQTEPGSMLGDLQLLKILISALKQFLL